MIKVSVVTVSFNSEKFIEQTIQSVINQDYENLEYIIIDGQSTDNTLAIIKRYAFLYPNLIKYVCEFDTGIYNAMNKGIKMSSGDIIGIINSDDWYEPETIIKVVSAYRTNGLAVYHGIQRTYNNEEVIGLQGTISNQLRRQMIEHPTCFLPRLLYEKFGLFDEKYQYVGDYELMLRLQLNKVPFIFIEEILANFREGGASHSFYAVQENYHLWLRYGLLSQKEFVYRSIMDRIKFYTTKKYGD